MASRRFARFGGLLSIVLIPLLLGCGNKVAAPTKFSTWNAKDGSFSIQYPSDWKADGGGQHGLQWAEFSQGSAKILVKVNLSSSLVGDIAGSAGQLAGIDGEEIDPQLQEALAPVHAAHEVSKELFVDEVAQSKEQEPVAFQSGLGDSRKSEFVASSGIGGKIRGYRATSLGHDRGVHILCRCSAGNWKTLQPAFDQILVSVGQGTPQ